MFARTQVQSRGWRVFAIVAIIFTAPILLKTALHGAWLKPAATSVALLGLAGFAFGFRLGPLMFWRVFTALFALGLMLKLGAQAAPLLHGADAAQLDGGNKPAAIALGSLVFVALCVALFRYSQLVPGSGSPHMTSAPAPLFVSRADHWRQVHKKIAENRAVMERPMSATMQAEALAFGPGRQLTIKRHQHVTTGLFLSAVAGQIAWALLGGGLAATVIPALALAVGAAVTTYCSAELVLKSAETLRKAWKGAAFVLAFVVVAFLVGHQESAKLWLARAVVSDAAALMLGNLLVMTISLGRRRT